MYIDKLRNRVIEIEKWCKDNEISIFYGDITDNAATEVSWTESKDTDWEKYLSILKRLNTKILILEIETNEVDVNDEVFLEYNEEIKEGLQEYKNELKIVEKTNGQIASITLNFIQENVCYSYSLFADWYDEYVDILDLLDFDDEGENEIPESSKLNEERIEELAGKIASNEKYLKAKNRNQRNEILRNLLKQDNIEPIDLYHISLKASTILDEIRAIDQKELHKKVLELKSQGLTKSAISSKLNIGRDIVTKYFSQENALD